MALRRPRAKGTEPIRVEAMLLALAGLRTPRARPAAADRRGAASSVLGIALLLSIRLAQVWCGDAACARIRRRSNVNFGSFHLRSITFARPERSKVPGNPDSGRGGTFDRSYGSASPSRTRSPEPTG